ncbi:carcinoembryonic antigen-related cell adhesion molecule 1-like isoform X2 [Coregonus clupeaformis]|uniref:carcinoembryonic antigen-related cell adhesion molecule 1-like isoform X2 n=1 Tax=Coregonus clupeaformis TaxID=59861 RepID=UPI001E1C684F|nr:carcinoembryonic antigen-related cell adhesion molecule 1-like isoform X2 [Coregonus clupeaformis]
MALRTAGCVLVVFLWYVEEKGQEVTLTCSTTSDNPNPTYIWYRNGQRLDEATSKQHSVKIYYSDSYSCAVKGCEALCSPAVCVLDQNCFNVTYTLQSICAMKGSTVELPCTYQHPSNHIVSEANWYIQEKRDEGLKILTSECADPVVFGVDKEKDCTLRFKDMRASDSAEYKFRFKTQFSEWGYSFPGTTLTVTGLQVKVTPATEKGILTLTCSTTCTLTDDPNPTYIWYKNGQRLTNSKTQDNYLSLDPVSSEDAGRYSCTIEGYKNLHSPVLSVGEQSSLKEAAVGIIVVVLILILCLSGFMWFRKKASISTSDIRDTAEHGQRDSSPVYDNVSGMAMAPNAAQRADTGEHDDVHYASVHHKKQEVPQHSTVQLPQPQKQDEDVQYAAVKFNHPSATQ